MPELPEVEAWVRELDPLVSAAPVERAGPAHIATLKTADPPLSTLAGRGLAGARRRGKNLLFPTEDGELVVRVHLMSAGRVRYLAPAAKGPKTPMFRLRFADGGQLVLTEAGKK
ncbi:MAG: DNA-formamidopyrimidine glycosylase family protein, partial [Actinomycetota bacterium]